MKKQTHPSSAGSAPIAAVTALLALTALGGGCMRMQTQQATLEHRPTVVSPEGTAVADVPGERDERDRGR